MTGPRAAPASSRAAKSATPRSWLWKLCFWIPFAIAFGAFGGSMATMFGATGPFNWRAAAWFAVAVPLGFLLGPKLLNAVSRLFADALFQHGGGARASGRASATWRAWRSARARARADAAALDVDALVGGLARALDDALAPEFTVRRDGSDLVVTKGATDWRVRVRADEDLLGRSANEVLAGAVTEALDAVRTYVAREHGSWKPATTGSHARAECTIDGLRIWFEQMGRPTALLGTIAHGVKEPVRPV